ncbi:protein of unknown function [Oceanicella actignis]|uniref:Uncharacterized protein n=1 Tax=Oceanicella actignis TaxID=1189325 RepID=A0A1M7T406_9RHOB|nr:uncharacterized protein DUF898 [Oceanicella actignis]SET40724.1 protein of unknown function [Oceanicella actignis]SHN65392.1 protein of unknown function [Oceanicella actignis]
MDIVALFGDLIREDAERLYGDDELSAASPRKAGGGRSGAEADAARARATPASAKAAQKAPRNAAAPPAPSAKAPETSPARTASKDAAGRRPPLPDPAKGAPTHEPAAPSPARPEPDRPAPDNAAPDRPAPDHPAPEPPEAVEPMPERSAPAAGESAAAAAQPVDEDQPILTADPYDEAEPENGAAGPEAPGAPWADADGAMAFDAEDDGPLNRLALRGALLASFTLGLGLPWLRAAIDEALWARTLIDGEAVRMASTRRAALRDGAMLAAIGAAIALGAWLAAPAALAALGAPEAAGLRAAAAALLAALPLGALAQLATWRRRARLLGAASWRGVGAALRGSAWSLPALWLAWAPLVIGSAGLLAPFWRMARERHMLRRAYWGEERFGFEASALGAAPRWLAFWALTAGGGALAAIGALGPDLPPALHPLLGPVAELVRAAWRAPGAELALALWAGAGAAALFAYRAAELRAMIGGLRLGGAAARCGLRASGLWAALASTALRALWPGALIWAALALIAAIPLAANAALGAPGADYWRNPVLAAASLGAAGALGAAWSLWLWSAAWLRARHARLCMASDVIAVEDLRALRWRMSGAAPPRVAKADASE